MRKEISFVLIMALSGFCTGVTITAILCGIASPSYDGLILTLAEKDDFQAMFKLGEWINDHLTWFTLPTLAISFIALIFYLKILNPGITIANLKNKTSILKFGAVLILLTIVHSLFAIMEYAFGVEILRPLMSIGSGDNITTSSAVFMAYVEAAVIGGLTWMIIGETGWAGDLSSFKLQAGKQKPRIIESLLFGVVVGTVTSALLFFFDWTFNRFFLLINEVLDGSGETSLLGFKYLGLMIVSILMTCSAIFASLTVALAPVRQDWRYRRIRLILPTLLAGILFIAVWGIDRHASTKYDLNQKDLGQAAGLDSLAIQSKTVLLFKPKNDTDKFIIQEWAMEVEGYSMMGKNSIVLSQNNLSKVAAFIDSRPDGSVFKYTALDVLYKGYYALWDIDNGLKHHKTAAQHLLLPRMMLIARAKQMLVTEQNLSYLQAFTNESIWHVGVKAAPKMAAGFIHFNLFDEAALWLAKGAKGNDVQSGSSEELTIPEEPFLIHGKITGEIKINGKIPDGSKAALFAAERIGEQIKVWDNAISMVAVSVIDQAGRFNFKNLSEGNYVLALIADSQTIPHSDSAGNVEVSNLPAPIEITAVKPSVDLGSIEITVKL